MVKARQIALSSWMCLAMALLLSGCMYDRPEEMPSDARMLSEGNGPLSYRTTEPGTVYIFDRNNNRMIYSGQVEADQLVEVNPQQDRISIDGRTVFEKGLNGNMNTRRLFFEPSQTVERRTEIRETRTRIEEKK